MPFAKKPAQPAQPKAPAKPAEPVKPATPASPSLPATPKEPKAPQLPAEPKQPAEPIVGVLNPIIYDTESPDSFRNKIELIRELNRLRGMLTPGIVNMQLQKCIACLRQLERRYDTVRVTDEKEYNEVTSFHRRQVEEVEKRKKAEEERNARLKTELKEDLSEEELEAMLAAKKAEKAKQPQN
jgi:hypothetical protein